MKSFRKEFTFSRIQYGVGDIRYSLHSSSHQSQVLVNIFFFMRTHRFEDLNNGTWSELKLKIEVELDQIGPNIEFVCVFVWATFLLSTIPIYNLIIITKAIWMHVCAILRNKMNFFFAFMLQSDAIGTVFPMS